MRMLRCIALLGPLLLAACGADKTVVVNPTPGQAVVVPQSSGVKVCPSGSVC
jgi:uncharacterized protein YcfL